MKRLTQEQFDFFQENGFIKLSNILSPQELQEICNEYDELFAR